MTPKAGEKASKTRVTQVGRALAQLGIEHIAAYSPEACGRSGRMFRKLQDRLPKELRLASITTIEAANRCLAEMGITELNVLFEIEPEQEGSAFVPDRNGQGWVILGVQEEHVVAKDNTVAWNGLRVQLPESPLRPHFVSFAVRVHEHWDGAISVHYGPHRLAEYTAPGEIISAPAVTSVAACSEPSRRSLDTSTPEAAASRRPTLTAPARAATAITRAGTKERVSSRTKELPRKAPRKAAA